MKLKQRLFRSGTISATIALLILPLAMAAPAQAAPDPVPSVDRAPMGTLACGYNVGFGGTGRWYRNCSGQEVNLGAIPFQGLYCVKPYSYRELSAFSFAVQIVSRDCSNPQTDK